MESVTKTDSKTGSSSLSSISPPFSSFPLLFLFSSSSLLLLSYSSPPHQADMLLSTLASSNGRENERLEAPTNTGTCRCPSLLADSKPSIPQSFHSSIPPSFHPSIPPSLHPQVSSLVDPTSLLSCTSSSRCQAAPPPLHSLLQGVSHHWTPTNLDKS